MAGLSAKDVRLVSTSSARRMARTIWTSCGRSFRSRCGASFRPTTPPTTRWATTVASTRRSSIRSCRRRCSSSGARYAGQNPLVIRFARTRDGRAYRFSDVVRTELVRRARAVPRALRPAGRALPDRLHAALAAGHDVRHRAVARQPRLQRTRPRDAQPRAPAPDPGLSQRPGTRACGDGHRARCAEASTRRARRSRSSNAAQVVVLLARARASACASWAGARARPCPGAVLAPGPTGQRGTRCAWRAPASSCDACRRAGAGAWCCSSNVPPRALSPVALRGLGLSAREAEVLRLFALGAGTREIAATLQISPRTVYKHTQHIHSKLGTSDRAQAIATALAAEHEPRLAAA